MYGIHFSVADYIIFFATILITASIGVFFAVWDRKRNTPTNYFLAGRRSGTLPVALSFVVSFQSSILLLGIPAESFAYGIGLAYCAVGIFAAFTVATVLIIPVFHPLKLTSVYEYFSIRYGNNVVRNITLAAGIIYTLFYMSTVTVGTCYALNVVMGIPFWGTILIYTVFTSIYTSIGGMKAVIWTDNFQLIVMTTGMVVVLIKSSADAGGSSKVFELAKDRLATDFRFNPTIRYQFWNVSFGTFTWMFYRTLTQPAMQRIYSVPTAQTARNLYFIATPIYAVMSVMAVFEGAILFAYYAAKRCDIFEAGIVQNVNEIIPFAILELFRHQPGLSGLFTASLSSAVLSTMSSCLSSLSAVTYVDIINAQFPEMHAYKATRVSKYVVLLFGLVAMGLSFALSQVSGSVVSIFQSFMGCMDGPMCAIFLLSILYRKTTSKGAVASIVCGSAVAFWLNVGRQFSDIPPYPRLPPGPTDHCYIYENRTLTSSFDDNSYVSTNNSLLFINTSTTLPVSPTIHESDDSFSLIDKIYSVSYVLYSLIGFLVSLITGIVISCFTKPPEHIDERCLFSFKVDILEEWCQRRKSNTCKISNELNDPNELTELSTHD